jgi:pyruvate dehydrogenase E2 component (dihydrolipoamide acetyltransferase)
MIAEKEGIDLSLIKGSGPGGLIVEEDVIKYVEEVRKRTKTGLRVREVIPLTSLRMTIAERMTESLRTMAQVTICREEVVDNVVKIREELLPLVEKEVGIRLTYTPILIKLVAEVLKEFPIINSTLEDNMIKVIDEINIGFAVAVDHGLVVPVVKEADKKSLKEVVIICNELTRKAREGRLSIEDVSGGTFTITNLGMYGIDAFTPIINPPQIAILGVGRFVQKPVVQEGRVNIATVCTFSLTFDHRVVDGHTAAQFLDKLVSLIKDESRLRAVLSVK